jgi:hypothetical protein
MGLLLALTAATFAQTPTTQPVENKPLIKEETKQEVREKTQEVKQDVREKAQEVKQDVREGAKEVKEDVREGANRLEQNTREIRQDINEKSKEVGQRVSEEVRDEVNAVRTRNDQQGLPWFERGSVFVGGSVGVGLGSNTGTYLVLSPRIGYFFQPGFMGGIRLSYDRRLSTSFRSNQVGVFARYYPFRTRISGFAGAGYNIGRERASNISDTDKARFNSITLEAGAMFYASRNLGVEASLETNYYDRSNPLAGRNRGGRAKVGINYYFTRKVK